MKWSCGVVRSLWKQALVTSETLTASACLKHSSFHRTDSKTWIDQLVSNCECDVSLITTRATCEINTPLQTQHRSSVRISHIATTHPARLRYHSLGSSPMVSSPQHTNNRASRHSSRFLFPGNALVHTSAGFRRSVHLLKLQLPIHQRFLQPGATQTNMF